MIKKYFIQKFGVINICVFFVLSIRGILTPQFAQAFPSKVIIDQVGKANVIDEYRIMLCIRFGHIQCCEFSSNTNIILLNSSQCSPMFRELSEEKPLRVSYVSAVDTSDDATYFCPRLRERNFWIENQVMKVTLMDSIQCPVPISDSE